MPHRVKTTSILFFDMQTEDPVQAENDAKAAALAIANGKTPAHIPTKINRGTLTRQYVRKIAKPATASTGGQTATAALKSATPAPTIAAVAAEPTQPATQATTVTTAPPPPSPAT